MSVTHIDIDEDALERTAAHHGLTVLHDDAGYRTVARHTPDFSEHNIHDVS